MPFCSNCGSKLPDGAVFCSNCGTPQSKQPEPAQQPTPVQQQAPVQQPAYYGYAPVKKKTSPVIFIAIAAVLIVTAAVVFIFVLGGKGGSGLKDFDYDDIVGEYTGTITPGKYALKGNWEEYADSIGESLDTVNESIDEYNDDYKGEKIEIEVTLDDDSIYFYCPDYYVFFGDDSISVEEFEFGDNGVAKGKYEDDYYGTSIVMEYKVTLKADGEGYRLVGEVTYSSGMTFDYNNKEYDISYSNSFDFDVTTEDQ